MYENDVYDGNMKTDGMRYGKFFTIPQDPSDRAILLEVDRKTRGDINEKYNLSVQYDWQCNTITNHLIETLLNEISVKLGSIGKDAMNDKVAIGVELFDILNAYSSIKVNENAEKEGNINIWFTPGKKVEDLIKFGPTEYDGGLVDYKTAFITGNPEEDKFYSELETRARYALNVKSGIVMTDKLKYAIFAISYTFIENIYTVLLYHLANDKTGTSEGEETMVSVNFNDNIEFHAVKSVDGTVKIMLRPGMNAKLIIKSDELTEDTMDVDDIEYKF